ncbi:MAG: hypothetical protein LBT59_12820 [Clostridiales bacterium]|jgi:nitrogenase molybdenum-iron protein beta chain|nr:hypothetical protein [Clostridiales bacterium]
MSTFIERAKFSCALGGAISTVAGIHRAIPIVHAAGGCAGMLSGSYNLAAGYRGLGYCGGNMIPTSNIAENNIVFGGEDRLSEQIEHTLKALDGDLYVVLTGCQVEIIGDDAVAVAGKFKSQNVIGVSTPGFLGNALKGYDAVLSAVARGTVQEAPVKDPLTVNILGVVPGHDVFYRGNLEEIKRLLGLIGVKSNVYFAAGETVEDIKKSGNAALNLVLSPVSGVLTAAAYKDVHGIPWLRSELPIGPTGTRAFLLQVGEALGISKALVEKVLRAEESYYYSYLERIVDIYSDLDFQRYAIVAADSYYAHALTRFLANDLGWIPHLTSINDIEGEFEREEYRASFSDINSETKPIVVFEQNAGEILNRIRESWPLNRSQKYYDSLSPAYVVGSGIERDLADKLGAAFLAVAYPVSNRVVLNKGYAGYRGSLTFLEDLFTNLVAAR